MKKVWLIKDKESNSIVVGFDEEAEADQYVEMNPFGDKGLSVCEVEVFENFLEYVGTPKVIP